MTGGDGSREQDRGWAPRLLLKRNANGAPAAAILAVAAIGGAGLAGAAVLGWDTDDIVFIPSVLVLATYLLGAVAAIRLFHGRNRAVATIAAALLLVTVPFAGWHLVVPLLVAAGGVVVHRRRRARARRATGGTPSRSAGP